MGCCQSTSSDEAQLPYNNADSSSRAITSAPTPALDAPSPRTSSHVGSGSQSSRRPLALTEQFNQPVRPHVWTAKRKWTRQELHREREEFFDTRVTGRQEIWGTLKMALGLIAEHEIETAQGVLDASGITVPTGDLINGAYDEAGNFYPIPEHIVSDPGNIVVGDSVAKAESAVVENETEEEEEAERRREEKGKGVVKSGDLVKVKARLSDRGGPDVVVMLSKDQNVRVLIRRVEEEAGILGKGKIKIAYLGKILKEGEPLVAQGWCEGHIVNALVFQ